MIFNEFQFFLKIHTHTQKTPYALIQICNSKKQNLYENTPHPMEIVTNLKSLYIVYISNKTPKLS